MVGDAAKSLSARDCYVGQRVYWVMWVNEDDARLDRDSKRPVCGWFGYRDGLSPEIWSSCVSKLHKNGTIVLDHYGKASTVYSCELHAVQGAYEAFCLLNMSPSWKSWRKLCRLGEASRVLRLLAELEYGLHRSQLREEVTHGR